MTDFKKLHLDEQSYNISKHILPSSSYIDLGSDYARFVPYIVAGEGGFGEHKQINWTNKQIMDHLVNLPTTTRNILQKEKISDEEKEKLSDKEKYIAEMDLEYRINLLADMKKTVDVKLFEQKIDIQKLKQKNYLTKKNI